MCSLAQFDGKWNRVLCTDCCVKICIDCLGLGACIFASDMILAILPIVFCCSVFSGNSSVLSGPMENCRGQPVAVVGFLGVFFFF